MCLHFWIEILQNQYLWFKILLFVLCIAFKSYIIPVFTDCKYGFSSDSQSTKELAKFELQS